MSNQEFLQGDAAVKGRASKSARDRADYDGKRTVSPNTVSLSLQTALHGYSVVPATSPSKAELSLERLPKSKEIFFGSDRRPPRF